MTYNYFTYNNNMKFKFCQKITKRGYVYSRKSEKAHGWSLYPSCLWAVDWCSKSVLSCCCMAHWRLLQLTCVTSIPGLPYACYVDNKMYKTWITSYLKDHSFRVSVGDATCSSQIVLWYSSRLYSWPSIFRTIIHKYNIDYHMYADGRQSYLKSSAKS